jgi:general secretion pathway protein G
MRRAVTLVEIMVVVSIVIILVTIAVPSILRSRVTADEGATMANLRTLNNACQSYHMENQSYPENLSVLSSARPPYIDDVLGSGTKQGYQFVYELVDPDHFTVHVNPIHTGLLKGRYFYLDESGEIRARIDGTAGSNDEIVG